MSLLAANTTFASDPEKSNGGASLTWRASWPSTADRRPFVFEDVADLCYWSANLRYARIARRDMA